MNQSSGKADKYISDEERQYFQDNIQDYLSPEDLLEEEGDADAGAVTGTGTGTGDGTGTGAGTNIADEQAAHSRGNIADEQTAPSRANATNIGARAGAGARDEQAAHSRGAAFTVDRELKVDFATDPHADDSFKRAGLQQTKLSKLKAGKFNIKDTLDMHGMKVDDAAPELEQTINHAYANGNDCIKIIHGRGATQQLVARNSAGKSRLPANKFVAEDNSAQFGSYGKNQAKLKTCVLTWLRQDPMILAFCRALPRDGGKGATYVLLKTR